MDWKPADALQRPLPVLLLQLAVDREVGDSMAPGQAQDQDQGGVAPASRVFSTPLRAA